MAKTALTDTCFWLGLLDPTDQHHEDYLAASALIENHTLIVPWPCLYETICTRLIHRRDRLLLFETFLSKANVELLTDERYKDEALRQVFDFSRNHGNSYSLADSVIREVLKDTNLRIDLLVTFNIRDFKDICDIRRVEILS